MSGSPDGLAELRSMLGPDRVLDGASELELHAGDESSHSRHPPDAVVYPESTQEVSQILAWANEREIPVTAWGAGTSLEGNPIPIEGGLVLDMRHMDRIVHVWQDDLQVRVQTGMTFHGLNDRLKRSGLFFPPDPGASATIGGMIANNAGGVHAIKYGVTRDCVMALEVVLADGRVIQTGTRARKSSAAYDLTRLFIGSEGTLGIVTEATLQLSGLPSEVMAVIATFSTLEKAAQTVSEMMQAGLDPAALEIVDAEVIPLINDLEGLNLASGPTLLMEFHSGSKAGLREEIDFVREICAWNDALNFDSGLGREERDQLWAGRYAVHEAIQANASGCDTIIVDVAVPISAFPEIVTAAHDQLRQRDLVGYTFGHAGDGNLHVEILVDQSESMAWQRATEANRGIVRRTLELDGTVTGEHGIGIGKREFLREEHASSLEVMRSIKDLLDPNGIMNPGKKL